jgi:hypothetical protein
MFADVTLSFSTNEAAFDTVKSRSFSASSSDARSSMNTPNSGLSKSELR